MNKFGDFEVVADHKFEIIPCPYEQTTTYGQGTSLGPAAILAASQELEFYDDEFRLDPSELGIKTLDAIEIGLQDSDTEKPFAALEQACADSYNRNKFPIVLGGEHSLSLGAVKAAYQAAEGKLTLLHFDAHADLRKEYNGNPYNHACAIYSIYKACPKIKIVSVGIRNISKGECDWLRELEKQVEDNLIDEMPITIFYARDEFQKTFAFRSVVKEFKTDIAAQETNKRLSPGSKHKHWNSKDVISTIKNYGNHNFYITFDVDGLDSTLMPSTGTPEPGGLDWYTPTNIIREACKDSNLIGADIVELAPIKGFHAADFLVAKLVYKIIASKLALVL
ncbi:MAG: agmatinase family protein [Cyanobacteria bacterium]|nr:agmatinase family protein [Cyanobacteriota bacterium]MDA1020870.1 agmatinase family protein [Cyanobacteriota bacterium]